MNVAQSTSTEARISKNMRRIEICTRRLSNDSFHGAVQSRFRGRGMDFEELREYAPGDDVRAIDWNASARTALKLQAARVWVDPSGSALWTNATPQAAHASVLSLSLDFVF